MNFITKGIIFAGALLVACLPCLAQAAPTLYGSLDESASSGPSFLVTIDVTSGEVVRVGPLGANILDMAYDEHTGILYGIDGGSGEANNALYRINRSTGSATVIGSLGIVNGWGLAYNSISRRLFATNNTVADTGSGILVDQNLYEVNVTTGAASKIGPLNLSSSAVARGLTFDFTTESLYLIVEGPSGGLYHVDQTAGTASLIGPSNAILCCNERVLEFDASYNRLLAINSPWAPASTLLSVDRQTGSAALLAALSGVGTGAVRGATFVADSGNNPPVCSAGQAFPSVLWSPNHQFVPIVVMGITDPDGDSVSIIVTGVTQDEPVHERGAGNTSPDALIEGAGASVRAERLGRGNGRVYQLSFKAHDGKGGTCMGDVKVGVPHSLGKGLTAIDDGQIYDSTIP